MPLRVGVQSCSLFNICRKERLRLLCSSCWFVEKAQSSAAQPSGFHTIAIVHLGLTLFLTVLLAQVLMLLEHARFGDLKSYVEEKKANELHDALLNTDDFIDFCAQIAAGMEFLSKHEVSRGAF